MQIMLWFFNTALKDTGVVKVRVGVQVLVPLLALLMVFDSRGADSWTPTDV